MPGPREGAPGTGTVCPYLQRGAGVPLGEASKQEQADFSSSADLSQGPLSPPPDDSGVNGSRVLEPCPTPPYLHGHQLLHQHRILEVQPLAVSPGLDIVAERVDVDALQLQHGQLDRCPVVLELLDIVLQPLLVLLRELRVAAAGCGAGRAEKQTRRSITFSSPFSSLFSTPRLSSNIKMVVQGGKGILHGIVN